MDNQDILGHVLKILVQDADIQISQLTEAMCVNKEWYEIIQSYIHTNRVDDEFSSPSQMFQLMQAPKAALLQMQLTREVVSKREIRYRLYKVDKSRTVAKRHHFEEDFSDLQGKFLMSAVQTSNSNTYLHVTKNCTDKPVAEFQNDKKHGHLNLIVKDSSICVSKGGSAIPACDKSLPILSMNYNTQAKIKNIYLPKRFIIELPFLSEPPPESIPPSPTAPTNTPIVLTQEEAYTRASNLLASGCPVQSPTPQSSSPSPPSTERNTLFATPHHRFQSFNYDSDSPMLARHGNRSSEKSLGKQASNSEDAKWREDEQMYLGMRRDSGSEAQSSSSSSSGGARSPKLGYGAHAKPAELLRMAAPTADMLPVQMNHACMDLTGTPYQVACWLRQSSLSETQSEPLSLSSKEGFASNVGNTQERRNVTFYDHVTALPEAVVDTDPAHITLSEHDLSGNHQQMLSSRGDMCTWQPWVTAEMDSMNSSRVSRARGGSSTPDSSVFDEPEEGFLLRPPMPQRVKTQGVAGGDKEGLYCPHQIQPPRTCSVSEEGSSYQLEQGSRTPSSGRSGSCGVETSPARGEESQVVDTLFNQDSYIGRACAKLQVAGKKRLSWINKIMSGKKSEGGQGESARENYPFGGRVLRNKRPVWNPNVNGWSLNFKNRVRIASVKNFQLVDEMQEAHTNAPMTMQFGKLHSDEFILDIDPTRITVAQALAIALTTFKLPSSRSVKQYKYREHLRNLQKEEIERHNYTQLDYTNQELSWRSVLGVEGERADVRNDQLGVAQQDGTAWSLSHMHSQTFPPQTEEEGLVQHVSENGSFYF